MPLQCYVLLTAMLSILVESFHLFVLLAAFYDLDDACFFDSSIFRFVIYDWY